MHDHVNGRDQLSAEYQKRAIYYSDSDCVEYVTEDAFTVYDRVDDFLTLIFDETKINLVGFKLKGFKHFFDNHLKPLFKLNDEQFVYVVSVLEARCTELGSTIVDNDRRKRAYVAARKLAANDNVKLEGFDLQAAA